MIVVVRLRHHISLVTARHVVHPSTLPNPTQPSQRRRPTPSWILEIANFYWLSGCGDASPCQISSKSVHPLRRYHDFVIFQDGGRPPYWICLGVFGLPARSIWWSLTLCAKFGYDRCSSFNNMEASIFDAIGLKTPITPPKLQVLDDLTP